MFSILGFSFFEMQALEEYLHSVCLSDCYWALSWLFHKTVVTPIFLSHNVRLGTCHFMYDCCASFIEFICIQFHLPFYLSSRLILWGSLAILAVFLQIMNLRTDRKYCMDTESGKKKGIVEMPYKRKKCICILGDELRSCKSAKKPTDFDWHILKQKRQFMQPYKSRCDPLCLDELLFEW